jgi:hypothetical protein
MPLPALLGGLKGLLSGDGLISKGLEFVNKRWPPNMSEADKAAAEVTVKEMLHDQAMELRAALRDDEKLFNERTIALEGTAKDLQSIPYIGAVIIFLRGAFRPLFSYFTAYMDFIYFTSATERVMDSAGLVVRVVPLWTEQQETLLLAMNLLVLAFFFGERAMKNVLPLIVQVFANRAGKVETT